jgi:deazaflavin-dependent oxidoreductase (nitroreductase family)
MPKPPPPESPFWKVFGAMTGVHKKLFRATDGKVGGRMPFTGSPILILHHVGRKSGTRRESPLIYVPHGDDIAIIASKGGVDRNPAWFHNLMASPETVVELPGGERRRVRARLAEGDERRAWWDRAVAVYKPYAEYQTYTDRQIPVVLLDRSV